VGRFNIATGTVPKEESAQSPSLLIIGPNGTKSMIPIKNIGSMHLQQEDNISWSLRDDTCKLLLEISLPVTQAQLIMSDIFNARKRIQEM